MESRKIIDNGDEKWIRGDGELHRLDGPAYISKSGDKEWWVNGKPHRLDGPAIDWINGVQSFYIDGKRILDKDYLRISRNYKLKNII